MTPEGADDVQVERGAGVLPYGELVQLALGVGLVEGARIVVHPGASDVAVGTGVLPGEPPLQLVRRGVSTANAVIDLVVRVVVNPNRMVAGLGAYVDTIGAWRDRHGVGRRLRCGARIRCHGWHTRRRRSDYRGPAGVRTASSQKTRDDRGPHDKLTEGNHDWSFR